MELKDISLEFVKKYLRIDLAFTLDDTRLEQHISSAISFIKGYCGVYDLDDEFYKNNTFLVDVALIYIESMYDTGNPPTSNRFYSMLGLDGRYE